jgi:hypothetical protein
LAKVTDYQHLCYDRLEQQNKMFRAIINWDREKQKQISVDWELINQKIKVVHSELVKMYDKLKPYL